MIVHVNRKRSRHAPPRDQRVIAGKDRLRDVRSGLELQLSPQTFTQVNPIQSERLYEVAVGQAGVVPGSSVVDLYCGVGVLSMLCAKAGASVVGVEVSQTAVEDARRNVELNGIAGCEICCDDAGGEVWGASVDGPVDVFTINPPRAGIEHDVVGRVIAHSPRRIVYVSCNPVTLARDVQRFRREGYGVTAVQPVDMFPQTVHVEVVVRLKRGR